MDEVEQIIAELPKLGELGLLKSLSGDQLLGFVSVDLGLVESKYFADH